jgi:uncharacterized protein (TIGR02996 family)
MSDQKALLAAIWEDPHEDTPRLVYADWLQENGQPERAEFIRVQCELARMNEDDPKRVDLEQRETRLWKKHAKTWKAGLPKLLQAAPFHRGFPSPRRRAATGSQFLKLTADDLASAPLWDFSINQAEKTITRVVASDAMSRVGVLEIAAQQFMNRGAEVLSAANFRNVADLQLNANWIGEGGIAALVANPSIRNLRDLSLYSSDLTDNAIASLVSAPWFPSLRSLHLGNNPFRDQGIRTLIAAAASGSLRHLGLRGLTVGANGKRFENDTLAILFGSPHLAVLSHLDLGINYVGDSGVAILTSEKPSLMLRYLNLDNNAITDGGAELLAAWPGLRTVETLILSSNDIGPQGALALARSPYLTRLRALWLMFNPVVEAAGADARKVLIDCFGDAVKFQ